MRCSTAHPSATGSLLLDKPEGLAATRDGSGDLWMVTDNDDPSRPSELLRVALR